MLDKSSLLSYDGSLLYQIVRISTHGTCHGTMRGFNHILTVEIVAMGRYGNDGAHTKSYAYPEAQLKRELSISRLLVT